MHKIWISSCDQKCCGFSALHQISVCFFSLFFFFKHNFLVTLKEVPVFWWRCCSEQNLTTGGAWELNYLAQCCEQQKAEIPFNKKEKKKNHLGLTGWLITHTQGPMTYGGETPLFPPWPSCQQCSNQDHYQVMPGLTEIKQLKVGKKNIT